jgi:hypothetical protein
VAEPGVPERLSATVTGLPATPVQAARAWLQSAEDLPDAGLDVWTSRIGGVPIRFRCTDAALAELYRSRLVGLDPDPHDAPVLCLDLLETERVGWPPPDAVVDLRHDPASTAQRFARAQIAALLPPPDDGETGYPWVFFAPLTGHGLILVPTTSVLPPWTAGAPFALLLHLAFAWRGWRFLHAAALGSGEAGALLAGPGGVGKSGTTLAGIAHGLVTTGDDYLLVEPGVTPVAWPVYRLLKQDRAGLVRAGRSDLAGGAVNWSGKVELDLEAAFPGRMADSLKLRLILLPEVTGAQRTSVTRATPTEAFSAIAASMLTQLPGARMAGFSFLTRLTRTLPAYHLRLSADAQEIAGTVRKVLEG